MTRKAHALGMRHTVYRNASGLPNDEQVTTARDQALLGIAIQERFPKYYRYFSLSSFRLSRQAPCATTTGCSARVEGVDGIKTGYTRVSGFNLVTSVKRGDRHIVAVVLGGRSGGARDARMRDLINSHIAGGLDHADTVARASPRSAEPKTAEVRAAARTERPNLRRRQSRAGSGRLDADACRPHTPVSDATATITGSGLERADQAGQGEDRDGEARAAARHAVRHAQPQRLVVRRTAKPEPAKLSRRRRTRPARAPPVAVASTGPTYSARCPPWWSPPKKRPAARPRPKRR